MYDILFLARGYALSLLFALVVLVVGLRVIKYIKGLVKKALDKSTLDETLKPFLLSLTSNGLKVLLVLAVIDMLGVETTSFVAIIGAASLAIGFAFQGTLSNFAGGILLLSLRPFKVGDFIEAEGYTGTVEAVHIFTTTLVTVDNKVIIIPNGGLANASILNYSVKDTRRVDLNFGVGYEVDIREAKKVLLDVISKQAEVMDTPAPFVQVSEHADSAVIFTVRVWVKASDYWTVYFNLLEQVKIRFDEENISIPFPQMDVHIQKED